MRDTPISATGVIRAAVGAATGGMRPVVERMFADFFGMCPDAISSRMAKDSAVSGGHVRVPTGG